MLPVNKFVLLFYSKIKSTYVFSLLSCDLRCYASDICICNNFDELASHCIDRIIFFSALSWPYAEKWHSCLSFAHYYIWKSYNKSENKHGLNTGERKLYSIFILQHRLTFFMKYISSTKLLLYRIILIILTPFLSKQGIEKDSWGLYFVFIFHALTAIF